MLFIQHVLHPIVHTVPGTAPSVVELFYSHCQAKRQTSHQRAGRSPTTTMGGPAERYPQAGKPYGGWTPNAPTRGQRGIGWGFGVVMWLWVFHRAKNDMPHMLVRWYNLWFSAYVADRMFLLLSKLCILCRFLVRVHRGGSILGTITVAMATTAMGMGLTERLVLVCA